MILHPAFPYRLYLVLSTDACPGKDIMHVAKQAILGGIDIIQLREKDISTPGFVIKACSLKELTDKHNIPLIINDNKDVAEQINAAGIHVGINDMEPLYLRQHLSFQNKIIGYSIEYLNQIENEHSRVSDYLGVSPVFKTDTKTNTVTEWGLDGIAMLKELTDKPLVAIGNINLKNARDVVNAGADCIAVVSTICNAENPQKAAYELKNQIIK